MLRHLIVSSHFHRCQEVPTVYTQFLSSIGYTGIIIAIYLGHYGVKWFGMDGQKSLRRCVCFQSLIPLSMVVVLFIPSYRPSLMHSIPTALLGSRQYSVMKVDAMHSKIPLLYPVSFPRQDTFWTIISL